MVFGLLSKVNTVPNEFLGSRTDPFLTHALIVIVTLAVSRHHIQGLLDFEHKVENSTRRTIQRTAQRTTTTKSAVAPRQLVRRPRGMLHGSMTVGEMRFSGASI